VDAECLVRGDRRRMHRRRRSLFGWIHAARAESHEIPESDARHIAFFFFLFVRGGSITVDSGWHRRDGLVAVGLPCVVIVRPRPFLHGCCPAAGRPAAVDARRCPSLANPPPPPHPVSTAAAPVSTTAASAPRLHRRRPRLHHRRHQAAAPSPARVASGPACNAHCGRSASVEPPSPPGPLRSELYLWPFSRACSPGPPCPPPTRTISPRHSRSSLPSPPPSIGNRRIIYRGSLLLGSPPALVASAPPSPNWRQLAVSLLLLLLQSSLPRPQQSPCASASLSHSRLQTAATADSRTDCQTHLAESLAAAKIRRCPCDIAG